MKDYLISIIKQAISQPNKTTNHYLALRVLIPECEYYEKQFNQFDVNNDEDLEAAIDLICCVPMIVDDISKKEREVLREELRMQVPAFAEIMELNRKIMSQNAIKFLA